VQPLSQQVLHRPCEPPAHAPKEQEVMDKNDKRFAWLYFDILCIIIVLLCIEVVLIKILNLLKVIAYG